MNNILWRVSKYPPRLLYRLGLGSLVGDLVLLLITTGRKSGLPRETPLQYELIDDDFYIGSARGMSSDWVRNILANPLVEVRVKSRRFKGKAEVFTDPGMIANFLKIRLERHPKMVAAIMRGAGIDDLSDHEALEAYALNRALVVIHPLEEV